MTGAEYASAVADYVARRSAGRDLKVYREVKVGKTIIGKNRSIDVFCVCAKTKKAFAIECKYQDSQGQWTRRSPTRWTI